MVQGLKNILNISEEELLRITPLLFEKDYTSTALQFLGSPARTLNYWADEPNILPVGDEAGKRRRYSFFDMIWLIVIKELRTIGMEKKALSILKEELITPIDIDSLAKKVAEERIQMEATFRNHFKLSEETIKTLFDHLNEKKKDLEQLQSTKLYAYIMYSLGQQKVVRLLINKNGNHFLYLESDLAGLYHVENDYPELGNTYITINLSNVFTGLLCQPQIKDKFKEAFFTIEEWKLLQFLQKEKPVSIKVTYKGDRMDLLEIEKKKTIRAEARLTEIMLQKGYETIEIKSLKGNIVHCTSTEKHKL
jgi:DNA-binding transcriptional MerR regulator